MATNPIVAENETQGSVGWLFTNRSNTAIQGYVDKPSYNTGDTITFYASTPTASQSYRIDIYRLGWYGGLGGRLIATISGLTSTAQGYYDGATLQNCPTAYIDSATHLTEAGWASSATWTVPGNAVTGCYLAMFTLANSQQSACSFVVKGNTTADYVIVRPACTDQAYNTWGGHSLYTNPTVDTKVSFLRPTYSTGGGAGNILVYDLQAIHWLESRGYNLSYIADVDCYSNASQLLNYKAVLILGHNEYWTKQYRDGMEAAIAAGVGAGFLGANASYWQCRIENDHTGTISNATVVCYKVSTGSSNLALDPQYGTSNALVTAQWRDAVLNRPENAMIGIMFKDFTNGSNAAWTVDSNADTTYFTGTGLTKGSSYGSDLVGYEWDNIQTGGPSNLKTIGTTPMTGVALGASNSNTTTYIASSGALVFASGSVGWTWALDGYRWNAANVATIPGMQALTANMMTALIRQKNPVGFSAFSTHS